jgi:hypothetical protein
VLALSGPSVPQAAVDEVAAKAKSGEKVTEKQAKQFIDKTRPASKAKGKAKRKVEHWSPGCDSEPYDEEEVSEPGDSQQTIDTRVVIARLSEITRHNSEALHYLRSGLDPQLLPELSTKLAEAIQSFQVLIETLEPPSLDHLPHIIQNLISPALKARIEAFARDSENYELRDKVENALHDLVRDTSALIDKLLEDEDEQITN